MKKYKIFWGVSLIAIAVVIVLGSVFKDAGPFFGVPTFNIVLGIICLYWAIMSIVKHYAYIIYFPLAFIFMLFEGKIAEAVNYGSSNIISNWLLLFCALLLTIGSGILFSGKHKKYKKSCCNKTNGKNPEVSFSQMTKYIDCTDLKEESISVNMGACDVFFENIESYLGGATLTVDCNMSMVVINVPKSFNVICSINNHMGKFDCNAKENPNGKVLNITGENNMGVLTVNTVE